MAKHKEAKTKIQLKAPTQERSRQTVATILEACARLLARESFYEVTTDKIAKEAGVSIGSLYQFFGNKESVVLSLIKKINEEDKALMTQRLRSLQTMDPGQRVKGIVSASLEMMGTHAELRLKLQSIQNYLVDATYRGEITSYYMQLVKQLLPPMSGRDTDRVTYLIVTLCLSTMATMMMEKPDFAQDRILIDEMSVLIGRFLGIEDRVVIGEPARTVLA